MPGGWKLKSKAADDVDEGVRDCTRDNGSAPGCDKTEDQAVDRSDERGFPTLIDVTDREDYGLEQERRWKALRQAPKLTLQIAAIDEFFTDAGGRRDSDPED